MPLVTVLPMLLSLLFLGALASPGIAALDRFARFLTPLERFAYGAVLGIVAGTLALVPAAQGERGGVRGPVPGRGAHPELPGVRRPIVADRRLTAAT